MEREADIMQSHSKGYLSDSYVMVKCVMSMKLA